MTKTTPKKQLTLFDSTNIIVGIIIGAGIYETAPLIARSMGGPGGTLLIWLIGGLMALIGALCYAELATTYPHQGGDYVYLNQAYGPWAGFLFGWSQLAIVRPGDIALLAFVFARYAQTLYSPFEQAYVLFAALAVVVLTGINIIGVREGKWTQNILTVIKVAGILGIVSVGFMTNPAPSIATGSLNMDGVKLALILVLFTFGGWNEMAYVAAEIQRPERNILKALIIGTVSVTVLYLLINGAFLYVLGYETMIDSQAVATDTVAAVFPDIAGRAISILICISALGAVNGLIFTGARISYAMGTDHKPFSALGRWHPKLGTPVGALLAQGGIALVIVLIAGSFINTLIYVAPVVWMFFLATAMALFTLRHKDPERVRPYRIIAYPVPVILFSLICLFMLYNCIDYALKNNPIGFAVLGGMVLLGVVVYRFSKRNQKEESPDA